MYACSSIKENNDSLTIVKSLLQSKTIDLDIQDNKGYTALMLAVNTVNLSTVKMLLDFAPNIKLINKDNKSALDLAQEKDCMEIHDIIKNYINKLTLRGCFLHWKNQQIQQNYDNTIPNYVNLPKELVNHIMKFCP